MECKSTIQLEAWLNKSGRKRRGQTSTGTAYGYHGFDARKELQANPDVYSYYVDFS